MVLREGILQGSTTAELSVKTYGGSCIHAYYYSFGLSSALVLQPLLHLFFQFSLVKTLVHLNVLNNMQPLATNTHLRLKSHRSAEKIGQEHPRNVTHTDDVNKYQWNEYQFHKGFIFPLLYRY